MQYVKLISVMHNINACVSLDISGVMLCTVSMHM